MIKAIWNGKECFIDINKKQLFIREIEYTSQGMRIKENRSYNLDSFFMFTHPDVSALEWFQSKDPEAILSDSPLIYHKDDFTLLQKQLVKNIVESIVKKQLNRQRIRI